MKLSSEKHTAQYYYLLHCLVDISSRIDQNNNIGVTDMELQGEYK